MKENFSDLVKKIDIQVQEAQRVLNKLDSKTTTPTHIIIKMPKVKDKERILKAAREKQRVTYKGVPLRLSADFSKETLQSRGDWQEVFKVMKSKDLQPRLLYPAKLSFRIEGQIKCFPNKMDAKSPTPIDLIIKMPKVKGKERFLNAARNKQLITYRGVHI